MNCKNDRNRKNNILWQVFTALVLTCIGLTGCEKFVDVDVPKSELITESVFENEGTSNSAVLSIFSNLNNSATNSLTYGVAFHTGLYGDELTNYSSTATQVSLYRNIIGPENDVFFPLQYWREGFKNIYYMNSAIEGCNGSTSLSDQLKSQLIGEVKFARAFWYFYLVNLFGDVPVVSNTDWSMNNVVFRNSQTDVYNQIIQDLVDAKSLLKSDYVGADGVSSSMERTRPNNSAASALLARAYIYSNRWDKAESEANLVLDNKALYDTVGLNQVFLKNSKESILQISPNTLAADQSTLEARTFIIISNPTRSAISTSLLGAFETGDKRRDSWVGKYTNTAKVDFFYPNKYKVRQIALATEYSTVLRVGELYLIRAEARLKQNNIAGCRDDLNVIRRRAGLVAITTSDPAALMNQVISERRIELFSEGGHRWFDMKRYGIADQIMNATAVAKAGVWTDYKKLWPIPQSEININPKLTQNVGYPQ